MKVSEMQGPALNWAVNQIEECCDDPTTPPFSTDWAQGGPIIEREKTAIKENGYGHWFAKVGTGKWMRGPTPLIAAMRCYVASKLGDEVEIPDEIYND